MWRGSGLRDLGVDAHNLGVVAHNLGVDAHNLTRYTSRCGEGQDCLTGVGRRASTSARGKGSGRGTPSA